MNIPATQRFAGLAPARTRTGWTRPTAAEITNLEISLVIKQRGLETQEEVRALVDEIMRSHRQPVTFLDPRKPLDEPDQARRLICEAFRANGRKRAKLAARALKVWPLCADAYLLLADEEEDEAREEVLEEGFSVARDALVESYGEETVEKLLGEPEDDEKPLEDKPLRQLTEEASAIKFWADPETRPYLRLAIEIAKTYHAVNEPPSLYLGYLRRALRLCPNDNVGARYLMAPFLMELVSQDRAHLDELGVLLKRYAGETSTELYTRAWYQCERDETDVAKGTLERAFSANRWVPAIMMGIVDPPPLTEHLAPGSQEEAADYWLWNSDAWSSSIVARTLMVGWFAQLIEEAVEKGEIAREE